MSISHAGSIFAVEFLLKDLRMNGESGDCRWMSKAMAFFLSVGIGGLSSDGVGGFSSNHSLDFGIRFTLVGTRNVVSELFLHDNSS